MKFQSEYSQHSTRTHMLRNRKIIITLHTYVEMASKIYNFMRFNSRCTEHSATMRIPEISLKFIEFNKQTKYHQNETEKL